MMFDKFLSFNTKVIIALFAAGYWIYFRTLECYKLLPNQSLLSVILVMLWLYSNYYEPLVVPLGLFIMYSYSKYTKDKQFEL